MVEFVVFTEEYLRMFYDPATCSYTVPIGGEVAHKIGALRDENIMLRAKAERQTIELATLHKENEKLRQLVRGLDYCTDQMVDFRCDECPLHDNDESLRFACTRMMEELGFKKYGGDN